MISHNNVDKLPLNDIFFRKIASFQYYFINFVFVITYSYAQHPY